jgi:hypothetical protein
MVPANGITLYTLKKKLDDMLEEIKRLNADKSAIYLNNDHGMLRNGLHLLKKMSKKR